MKFNKTSGQGVKGGAESYYLDPWYTQELP